MICLLEFKTINITLIKTYWSLKKLCEEFSQRFVKRYHFTTN